MIRRALAWARRIVGLVALAAAAWWALEAIVAWWAFRYLGDHPQRGVDASTGEPYGVRVSPLSPAEREAALAVEREAADAWADELRHASWRSP